MDQNQSFFAGLPVVVTGGAGFIGSHLVDALVQLGARVTVLDNLSTGHRCNLDTVVDQIRWLEGDIRDEACCLDVCRGATVVFHAAGLGSVPRSMADPLQTSSVNVMGTVAILNAAVKSGVHRLVFSSSSSVYGDQPEPIKRESMRPEPRSPYAASKLAGEEYCRAFRHAYGLGTVSLRYFNVFGPRQDLASPYAAVIPRFIRAVMEGAPAVIHGDGNQSRDFTPVANVVAANLLAGSASPLRADLFNAACGGSVTVREVLTLIEARIGRSCGVELRPDRPGDVQHSRADVSLARQLLGYSPVVDFVSGLQETVDWYVTRGTLRPAAAASSPGSPVD